VLIDPFFTGNPAFEGDRKAATEGATHILVTHGHGDQTRKPPTSTVPPVFIGSSCLTPFEPSHMHRS
jgi:L-ascorbate metabolism protein UlaG (beta-lactamase superfamily)